MRQIFIMFSILYTLLVFIPISSAWADHGSKLSTDEIKVFLKKQPAWKLEEDKLTRTFKFKDGFKGAVHFIQRLVKPADRLKHHPDLQISYNRVTVTLTTHDAGGLTALDLKLAALITQVYNSILSPPSNARSGSEH